MKRFSILDAQWTERPVQLRLPFQFGNTEVRQTAEARCTVTILVDGEASTGVSAQLMVPRWFDKRTSLSNDDTIDELRDVVRAAVLAARGHEVSALSITRELRAAVRDESRDIPTLAAGFGPSLVEMAVIDALCRAMGLPFWQAARGDVFGLVDGCPSDLSPAALEASLATIGAPRRIVVRHTVGFDAPLRVGDVGDDAPDDGLPVALEDVIDRHGVTAFKLKLKGDPAADHRRLLDIASVVDSRADYSVTLDANEQYTPERFTALLDAIATDQQLERLYRAIRFVEQPFARDIALDTSVDAPLPLVIDESDDAEDAFARALVLGWAGTSIKSCKGVLRALLNRARAHATGAVLSGEDLTCQLGLCWQQDTTMMAACGVADVERNGHHFGGGMPGETDADRERLLRAHPDLYERENNHITLRLEGGEVAIASLDAPGFGHGHDESS